jgi:RHS repeat-associated protein
MNKSVSFHARALTLILSALIVVTQLGAPPKQAQAASSNSVSYIHDQAGRLVGVVDSTNAAVYKYDAVGNVLSISRYSAATVSIIQMTPSSASTGAQVIIYGTAFSATPSQNTVTFNGVTATVSSSSATQIVTSVPAGATTGTVKVVSASGSASSSSAFTVTASATPTITGFTPTIGKPGTAVSITGTNFQTTLTNNSTLFNTTHAVVTAASATTLSAMVPSVAGSGHLTVITPGGQAASSGDFFIPPDPYTAASVGTTGRVPMDGSEHSFTFGTASQIGLILFDGVAGQRFSTNIGLSMAGSGCCSNITIYNPNGSVLVPTGAFGCCFFSDVVNMAQTGTYTILIDQGATTGTATVQVWNVPPDVSSTIMPGGPSVTVTIATPGQNASITFSGTAGQNISLYTSASLNCCLFQQTVYSPDGSVLSPTGSFGCCAYVDRTTLAQTGTYRIYEDPGSTATGTMTLTLYSVPPDVMGTITIGGPQVSISNTVPGQNMQLTFSGTTGKTINLTSGFSPCGIGGITISNPDGTALFGPSGFPGCVWAIGPLTLPQTGTYTILIDPGGPAIQTANETLTDPPTPSAAPNQGGSTAGRSDGSRPSIHPAPRPPNALRPRAASKHDSADPNDQFAGSDDWFFSLGTHDPTYSRKTTSVWSGLPPLHAPPGVTALAGQALRLNGTPLAGVTLTFGGHSAQTDESGRFLLSSIASGTDVLAIDGRSASKPGRAYGYFEVRVDVIAGKTNVLPFAIWMTKLDQAHAVSFPSPTTRETVISTPEIPGLEVRLPAGTVIKDSDGKVVTQLSITAIPVNRPPFPLPAGAEVPLYFTVQPGSSYIFPSGARIIYPNYTHLAPGTRTNFWDYDPDQKGWFIYGHGTVTADGKQVVPDAGVIVWEFTGAMLSPAGYLAAIFGPILKGFGLDGDPVDLQTGLFVLRKIDMALPDIMPLTLSRTYRQGDKDSNGNYISRDFGIGTTNSFNMYLVGAPGAYQYADLMLPDGGKVHYVRTSPGTGFSDAVFQAQTTPSEFYLSKIVYNGHGWNLTLKNGTMYIFGDNAPLQAIRDRHGNQITLSRPGGPNSNITQVTSPNGRWIAFTYDASNRITQAQDNIGRTVSYTYDAVGNLWKVTDPNGGVTTYTYDANHNMLTLQDARQIVFLTNQYDANGRVIKQTQSDQTTYQFSYVLNGSNQVIETDVTDPRSIKRKVTFNGDGYLVTDTYAVGAPEQQTVTLTRQTGSDLVTSVTDALNRQTSFGYDTMGNVTSVTSLAGTPNAVTTQLTYEPTFNQISSVTDPLNHATQLGYDTNGNLATVTDALQHQTTIAYNYFGQPISTKDPFGNLTQLQYSFGDPVANVDPLGNTTKYFIDGAGRPITSTDPLGDVVRTDYDPLNRPTQVTDANGSVTAFTYDQNSNVKSAKDARTNTTSYSYDNMDRLITRTDPLLRSESYSYDANGNVSQFTDRKGQVTAFTYDNLNRETFAGFGKTVSHGVTSYQSTINYTYDAGDRLTKTVDSVGGTITPVFDNLDRLTSETTGQGQVTYTYDNASRRATMQVAGQPLVSYGYDNANRLTSITQGTSVVTPVYDTAGRLTSLSLPNGVVMAYGYNNGSQLTSITYTKGATTLGDLGYSYDSAGHRTGETGTFARTNFPAALTSAAYNADNQLTAWGSASLSYDANGNMLSDGTNSFTWDARNQLSSVGTKRTTSSFQYDAYGRRMQKSVAGNTTSYLYDGLNPVQELSGTTPTANMLTGLGVDQYVTRTDSAGTRNYLSDALGSTVALTDSNGAVQTSYTYEPFGNATSSGSSSTNSYQFTGRENDGAGLDFYRSRYYNPTFGRFVSEDPMGLSAGNPNLYGYAASEPTDFTDPSGNFIQAAAVGCLVGAAFAGLIDDIKLVNAQRKGRPGPDFGQFVGDIVGGCITGAVTAVVFAAAEVFGGWILARLGPEAEAVLSDAADACEVGPPNSFNAGTEVLMSDGSRKPIEQVMVGDRIRAGDPLTGSTKSERVTNVILGHGLKHMVKVRISGEVIEATYNHPFWVADKHEFVWAQDLKAGEKVELANGTTLQIDAVSKYDKALPVYNLSVSTIHTFYVGQHSVLVHNACPWITPGSLPAEEENAVSDTLRNIDAQTEPAGDLGVNWAKPFENREGALPGPSGSASPYSEYRVAPGPGTTGAGTRRVVVDGSNGEMYYTWTHYGTAGNPPFVRIR